MKVGWSYIEGSRSASGLGTSLSAVESGVEAPGVSSHGLGDNGIDGVANDTIGAAESGGGSTSSVVGALGSKGVELEEDAI